MKVFVIYRDEGSYSSRSWDVVGVCLSEQGAVETLKKLERLPHFRSEIDDLKTMVTKTMVTKTQRQWTQQSAQLWREANTHPDVVALVEEQKRYRGALLDSGLQGSDNCDSDATFHIVECDVRD